MKKKSAKKILSFLLVFAAVLFLLAGCRPSPALEEIIYTKDAKVVDVLRKKLEQDKRHEDSEKNDDFNGEEEGDDSGDVENENVNENGGGSASNQTNDLGTGTEGNGNSVNIQYSDSGTADKPAEGTAKTGGKKKQKNVKDGDGGLSEYEEKESSEQTDSGETAEKASSNDSDSQESVDITDPDEGSGNDPGSADDPEDNSQGAGEEQNHPERETKVIDYGGIEQEVPVNVDTVTACGYAAQLVEMLGGSGRLLGADAEFTSNWLSATLFADLDQIQTWWDYDGSYGLQDAGLQGMLDAEPEVLIGISGGNYADENQILTIEDNGIYYVTVPRPDSSENIINGAKIIATVLGDDGNGGSAMSIAENYESWVAQVKTDVNAGDLVVYSTFLSDWDNDAVYTFGASNYALLPSEAMIDKNGSGSGAAVAYSGTADVIFTEFWNDAGVTNEAANTGSKNVDAQIYVMPMFRNLAAEYNGNYTGYSNRSLAASADWGLVHVNEGGVEPTRVGDTNFTTIVAADSYVRDMILASWFWEWHGYGRTENGTFPYAYVPEGTSEVFYSSIAGPYEVVVNPSGLGSWITGSVDAPLEAYWATCYIRGDIGLDDLYARVADFYAQFYNMNLTDDEIAYILQGN